MKATDVELLVKINAKVLGDSDAEILSALRQYVRRMRQNFGGVHNILVQSKVKIENSPSRNLDDAER